MLLSVIERRGVGRTSLRLAVPGMVVGLAIGLIGPFDRKHRLTVPTPRQPI
ncbi:MAG TPA: hypothetical protein VLR26_07860 [Frankiaceae bacterium]|nr:hypothetical protein [Frankiaceae bacterium]